MDCYKPSDLPSGFRYPQSYLSLLGEQRDHDLYPWWLIDASSRAGTVMLSILRETGRLVPFAKSDVDDDIACFDGSDTSGQPKIEMFCSTPDRSYGFANFATWLEQARRDATSFRDSAPH
jgi:hypothetical protein